MSHKTGNTGNNTGDVVDFNRVREKKLEEKRQNAERIFFKQILGVYCVVAGQKVHEVAIVDVSSDGISFRVPFNERNPWPTDLDKDLQLRLYFTQDTYLPVIARIQNTAQLIDEGVRYHRYGCSIDKTVSSYPAYRSFVDFLKMYAEQARQDKGDVTLFYI